MRKKTLFIIPIVLILSILIFVFYPRKIEHGVLLHTEEKKSTFLVNGKEQTFSSKYILETTNTVWNFKYNLISAYSFNKQTPLTERIMTKDQTNYDLERSGPIAISKNAFFYEVDKDNNLTSSHKDKLIVGKENVQCYKDSKGALKTFILSPMNFSAMRVAISTTNFTSIYHDKLQITAATTGKIYSLREQLDLPFDKNAVINIESNKEKLLLKITDSTNNTTSKELKERLYIQGDSLNLNSIKRGSPNFEPNYSGILEVTNSPKGLLILNEIGLEEYLKKVVPSEMPALSSIEALKCQAIAARTYAISDMLLNRFAGLGFYVDDSTQSQVYNNVQPHPRTTEAIDATKGSIMTYNKQPIDAKYYSTSAGTGVNYKDIWFNSDGTSENRPYLTTKNYLTSNAALPTSEEQWLNFYKDKNLKAVDSNSPYFRWQIEFPKAALTSTLNKSIKSIYDKKRDFLLIKQGKDIVQELPELKNILDMKVLERSEGGNIIKMAFYFENATVEVAGDYNVRSAIRCSQDFAGTQITIARHKSTPITNMNFLPSSFFASEKGEDKFIIYGGGYGHGVGMSQYGAMELGKAGMDYKNILNTFYKDIALDSLY
jgi:SpoIID/LytB domain protein